MKENKILTAIRWHRENKEISSQEMAEVLGYDSSTYSNKEHGKRAMTMMDFIQIAEYMEIDMEELIVIPKRRKK